MLAESSSTQPPQHEITQPTSHKDVSDGSPDTSAKTASAPSTKKLNPRILLGVVAAVIVAGAAYFGVNVINTPARVKEQVVPAHQVFSDYNKSVVKILEDISSEDEIETADALERAVKKTDELLASARGQQSQLQELLANMTVAQAKMYKTSVEEYEKLAVQAIDMEQAQVDTLRNYAGVLKDLEEMGVEFAGLSQLMYSDPNVYVTKVDEMIGKLEGVNRRLSAIDAKAPFIDHHKNMMQGVENEISRLKDMRDGVKNRSLEKIGEATQKYAESSQKTANELERLKDKIKDDVEAISDDAMDAAEKVNMEYQSLQNKYSF